MPQFDNLRGLLLTKAEYSVRPAEFCMSDTPPQLCQSLLFLTELDGFQMTLNHSDSAN